jgi:hypothetical protein
VLARKLRPDLDDAVLLEAYRFQMTVKDGTAFRTDKAGGL